jgi:hypothetical protein
MTAAVIQCLEDALPGQLTKFGPRLLVRELLDEQTSVMLGLGEAGILGTVARKSLATQVRTAVRVKRLAQDYLVLTPLIWNRLANRRLNYLLNFKQPAGWNRSVFAIPDVLAAHWKVPKSG